MIEITCNDRLGKKVRIKCNPSDTVGDLKKLIAAQTGTAAERIILKKWLVVHDKARAQFSNISARLIGHIVT